jgi:hypothetical protein
MKFKCNITGCVYTFTEPLDIKAMKMSQDYTVVEDVPEPDPVKPATVVPVKPTVVAPDKPLPVPTVAPKAV